MKRSTTRILTTHTGSLPRPPDLVEMVRAREAGQPVDPTAFAARVASAVVEVVRKQTEAGVDVVSDGEMSKPAFNTYVAQRLSGFGRDNTEPRIRADNESFPGWASQTVQGGLVMKRRFCLGDVAYRD